MTYQEAKKELKAYRYIKLRVEAKRQRAAELKNRAAYLSTSISFAVGENTRRNRFEELMTKYFGLAEEAEKEAIKAEELRSKIEWKISLLDEPYQTLLRMRYLELMRFERIACDLNYSYDWIRHQHIRAVKMYAELRS